MQVLFDVSERERTVAFLAKRTDFEIFSKMIGTKISDNTKTFFDKNRVGKKLAHYAG